MSRRGENEVGKNDVLSEIKNQKKELELKLKELVEENEILKNKKRELENIQNKLTSKLKKNDEIIESIDNLREQKKELELIKKEKLQQGYNNIKFEKNIKYLKNQKIEAEYEQKSNLKQIKKIKNTAWKRFLIIFTCDWYNPIAKLEQKNRYLTLRIKNFDFWIQRRNKEATNLADKYMELENKMESIQNKMNSNQENLKKWNAKREKKQTFEENIVNLKNIQNQIKETNNKLNANLQTQNQWKEKYKIVVEKMVVEIEEIAHQDYCKEAKKTYS